MIRNLHIFFILSLFVSFLSGTEPDITLNIPMRDGFSLPIDIYFPKSTPPKESPCILVRSPAGRSNFYACRYTHMTEKGYVVAIQDTRSAIDLEGKTFPGLSDGWGKQQDGYDTVEWLASSPYSNGKIGTVGVSCLGITQLLLAPSAPPSLKCQYIGVACGSMYHHAVCPGGQIVKEQVEGWLGLYARDPGVLAYVINRPHYNTFWDNLNSLKVAHQVDVPGFFYGGWYDTFLQGTLDSFSARQEKGGPGAKQQQKLLIGPWTHFWPESSVLGDYHVPENARALPEEFSSDRWFDYHLKGDLNGIDAIPTVTYYLMGSHDGSSSKGNRWKTSDVWPVPHTAVEVFLSQDQTLIFGEPDAQSAYTSFYYDPRNPVPTVGGRNLFLESGPKDQQEIEKRNDVILFTTPPLEEDLEVTGKVVTKLYFSSSEQDTDVAVRLTDVYPDGKSILIVEGICRVALTPDQPQEVEVDLWSTSVLFPKGHRIRISISGSNYPRYERNHNVGLIGSNSGKFAVAKDKVHFGKNTPSRLILPVVK